MRVWVFCLLGMLRVIASAQPLSNAFYLVSAPGNAVGQGRTFLATPTNGYWFHADVSYRVYFTCNLSNSSESWDVTFEAPHGVLLTPGTYLNAGRAGFNPDLPGLDFTANGWGQNTLSGYFTVLEAQYTTNKGIVSFAADFVDYQNGWPFAWAEGSVRYNSKVPIPHPLVFLAFTNNNVVVSWPVLARGFTLYSSSTLTNRIWSSVSNVASNIDGTFSATVPIDRESRFFRLAR